MTEMEALRERHSVRQYKNEKIEAEKVSALKRLIDDCNQEGNLHLQLLEDAGNTFNRLLSRFMGLASAPSVIACIGPNDADLDQRVGYYGQKIVLAAQQMGLNTCWAGTFNAANVKAEIANGERLVIVIAIGYGVNGGKARKSKKPEQVMDGSFSEMPDWFIKGVEAALLAPTAINQQKFKIVPDGDTAKVVDLGGIFSKVDQGIVRYNFEVGSGRKAK